MIIANNATQKSFITNYSKQNSQLQTSMSRLSSGQRLVGPGDAPADLGISERFRAQIRNSEESGRVIQNAINMFQTSDTWLQEAHNILDRMSELSVAASDSSKSQADRKNLDLEFQQLKQEISRISEEGKYNGLQINGNTGVAVYDALEKRIVYTQPDGGDQREVAINLRDSNSSENNVKYAFETSAAGGTIGDFMFSENGKSLFYVAQKAETNLSARKTLMKLDIESNMITTVNLRSAGGTNIAYQARLVQDDQGRVWVSDPDTAVNSAAKTFSVRLLNEDDMTLDAGGVGAANEWAGGVTLASGFSNFSVHGDHIYYIERSGGAGNLQFIKQSLYDTTNKEVLLTNLSGADFDLDAAENYTISADGQYIAFEDADNANTGTLVVINTDSGKKASQQVGTRANSLVSLDFDANNNLYWTDTGSTSDENAIKRAKIKFGDKPEIENIETVRTGNAGHFGAYNSAMAAHGVGLSVRGGSPASSYQFQVGPDAGMEVDFVTADISLTRLGVSHLDVLDLDTAKESIAAVAKAIDHVANKRAVIGAQVSRLGFIFSANAGYKDNISASESLIRDVDIAQESSKLTQAQILAQTGVSILAQANQSKQNILKLIG